MLVGLLLTSVYCGKMVDLIEMLFALMTRCHVRKYVSDAVHFPRGNVTYRENMASVMDKKRLNQLSCCLGC